MNKAYFLVFGLILLVGCTQTQEDLDEEEPKALIYIGGVTGYTNGYVLIGIDNTWEEPIPVEDYTCILKDKYRKELERVIMKVEDPTTEFEEPIKPQEQRMIICKFSHDMLIEGEYYTVELVMPNGASDKHNFLPSPPAIPV